MVQHFEEFTMLYGVVLFQRELFDLPRSLLFSSSLLHLRCISGPRSTAIGPARSGCPSAIGWNRLHVKCDWSMVGKAERRCVVIFFFCSAVHMLEVNKPGVDIISVLQFVKQRETETFLTFSFIKFIYETYCPNRTDFGYYVLQEKTLKSSF